MKKKCVLMITILSLLLQASGVLPGPEFKTASAEEKVSEEKVLIPDEKYWKYEERDDGTIRITGFNDMADYTDADGENECIRDEDGRASGITYKLIIPSQISGKNVTAVGVYTDAEFFYTYRTITSVQIPEGVTYISYIADNSLLSVELPSTLQEIGDFTFVNCKNLQSVELPEKLEAIGREAFYGCHSLQNIVIPASVSEIGNHAFADCTNLQSFSVNQNNKGGYYSEDGILYVKSTSSEYNDVLDDYEDIEYKFLISYPGGKAGVYNLAADMDFEWTAFLNAKKLTAINVDPKNPDYTSIDGIVYTKDMTGLCVCPAGKSGEYKVPEGVCYIQTNSFSNSELSTIYLPDSMGDSYTVGDYTDQGFIGNGAFSESDALQTIFLGKNITKKMASQICSAPNLENITVSEENPHICAINNILYDKELKTLLYIPAGVEGKLVLPDTVETSDILGASKEQVTEVVLGKNYAVKELASLWEINGKEEFEYNYVEGIPYLTSLQSYEVSPDNKTLATYEGLLYSKDMKILYHCPPAKSGTVTIPEGTTTIFGEVFSHSREVKEVIIPASVTDIQCSFSDFSGKTIKGYTGSAAEKYVKNANKAGKNLKFIALQDNNNKTSVTKPGKVVIQSLKYKKSKSAVLIIKNVPGADGYQVQYATNKKFKQKVSKSLKKTEVTIKNLEEKKTYYFRVRAYKLNGKEKVYGKWSGIKKVRIKK